MTNAHCITQFLAEGTLGPLGLGMTGDQVIAAIGEPNDIGCQEIRNGLESSIWLYGTTDKANLQLRLDRGTLEGFWLYFRGADDLSALPKWMDAESSKSLVSRMSERCAKSASNSANGSTSRSCN